MPAVTAITGTGNSGSKCTDHLRNIHVINPSRPAAARVTAAHVVGRSSWTTSGGWSRWVASIAVI